MELNKDNEGLEKRLPPTTLKGSGFTRSYMKSTRIITLTATALFATQLANAGTAHAPHKQPAAKAPPASVVYRMTDSDCMAVNLFKEANTATEREQRLVNSVVLNRIAINGGTACSQVFAPKQFSWANGIARKYTFKSQADMLAYYRVPADSFVKMQGVVAQTLLERTVLDYASGAAFAGGGAGASAATSGEGARKGAGKVAGASAGGTQKRTSGAAKADELVVMYHDLSIKRFRTSNAKALKVVAKTKNFVWYSTAQLAAHKG